MKSTPTPSSVINVRPTLIIRILRIMGIGYTRVERGSVSKRWKMIASWWLDPNRLVLSGFILYLVGFFWIVQKLYIHFKFRFLGKLCEIIGISDRRDFLFAGVLLFFLLLILAIGLAIDCIDDN